MRREKKLGLFDDFDHMRCLVIGDVMVDSYIWGSVNRQSPEAPVPVFEVEKRENRVGGAANVALNIAALGGQPILCGVVGEDPKGYVFKQLLADLKLSSDGIVQDDSRTTTSKTRIISTPDHMMRVDEEKIDSVSTKTTDKMFRYIETIMQQGINVIVFEDYDKGLLGSVFIQKVIKLALKLGIPTCVDPKKENFHNYQGATLFKPNFKELTEGLNTDLQQEDFLEIDKLSKDFLSKQNIGQMLVTLSEHGLMSVGEEHSYHLPALERRILDVSGAGDTVISTAALALAVGFDDFEVATLANLAGGIVCEQVGVVPISKNMLQDEYKKLD